MSFRFPDPHTMQKSLHKNKDIILAFPRNSINTIVKIAVESLANQERTVVEIEYEPTFILDKWNIKNPKNSLGLPIAPYDWETELKYLVAISKALKACAKKI